MSTDALNPDGIFEFPLPTMPGDASPPRMARARYLTIRQWQKFGNRLNEIYQMQGDGYLEALVEHISSYIISVDGQSEFDLGDMMTDTGLIGLAERFKTYASMSEVELKKSESPLPSDAAKKDCVDPAPEGHA
jgi:hypothetical protein